MAGHKVIRLELAELCDRLVKENLVRIEGATLDKYLELYANDDSVELSPLQLKAIDKLYELGAEHGFYDTLIKAEDYLIPREYNQLRNS